MGPKENQLCLAEHYSFLGQCTINSLQREVGGIGEANTTGSKESTSTGKEDLPEFRGSMSPASSGAS